MSELTHADIDWLQNGEPVTGGTDAQPSAGVMNRPLIQLQENITDVNNNLTSPPLPFSRLHTGPWPALPVPARRTGPAAPYG